MSSTAIDVNSNDVSETDSTKLPFVQKAGYALGIHGIMYFWYSVSLYLFYFYTDVVGLTPAQAGTIFFISVIWDGITDPIMGTFTDRLVARGWKYRPLVLVGAIPFCFSFVAIFYIPEAVTNVFVYCLIANLIFRTFWTMTYIPYTSMLTRITPDSDERANIGGLKTIFIGLAKLPVSYFALTLVAYFGAGDEATGFLFTMIIIACMAFIAFIASYILTPENAGGTGEIKEKLKLDQILGNFKKNSQMWIVMGGLFMGSGSFGIVMASIIYYFKYNLNDADSAKLAMTALAFASLIGVPIWMKIIPRLGNRLVWFSGMSLATLSLVTLFFIPDAGTLVTTVLIFLATAGIYGFIMTFLPMTADCVDFGQWRSGYRVEALTFGFVSLMNKLSIAFGGWLIGTLQTLVGFEANVEQSASTLMGLKAILTLVPAIGFILSATFIWFYRINSETHKSILDDIKQTKA